MVTRLLRASCWYPPVLSLFTSSGAVRAKAGTGGWAQGSSSHCHQLPQGAEQCPSCLGGERGLRQRSGKLSVLCAGFLCARRHQCTRRPQIFQAPVSQGGHLGRVLAQSPQTHQATRNPKAPGRIVPVSCVPKRLGCATQGSAQLFLLPDPTRRVRTECDLQTRRAGAGGGRAQAQVRLGGPTGTGSLPLSPSVAASAVVRTD